MGNIPHNSLWGFGTTQYPFDRLRKIASQMIGLIFQFFFFFAAMPGQDKNRFDPRPFPCFNI